MYMKTKMTYEQASAQLEQLVQEIELGSLGIDHLAEKVKKAQELIEFCRQKLVQVEEEIREIIPDEDK